MGPDRTAGAARPATTSTTSRSPACSRARAGPGRPHFPTNLVGDFGGGSTYLVIGVLAALLEARPAGRGQVVDAAIVDGAAHLNAMGLECWPPGWRPSGAPPTCSTAAPRSTTCTRPPTAGTCAVGALEPQFYDELVRRARHRRPRTRPRRPGQPPGPAGCSSPRRSAPARSPSGPRSSTAPTPASRRCCRSARRCTTRTWRHDRCTSTGRRPRAGAGAAVLQDRATLTPPRPTRRAAHQRGPRRVGRRRRRVPAGLRRRGPGLTVPPGGGGPGGWEGGVTTKEAHGVTTRSGTRPKRPRARSRRGGDATDNERLEAEGQRDQSRRTEAGGER